MKKLFYPLIYLFFSTQVHAFLCPPLSVVKESTFDKPIRKDIRYMVVGNVLFNNLISMGVIRIPDANSAEEALTKAEIVLKTKHLHEPDKIDAQGKQGCLYFGDATNKNSEAVFVFDY